MEASRQAGVPVVVVCGQAEIAPPGVTVASLAGRFDLERAMEDTRRALEDLVAELATSLPARIPPRS